LALIMVGPAFMPSTWLRKARTSILVMPTPLASSPSYEGNTHISRLKHILMWLRHVLF
jgi:hypothetical protein